MTIDKKKIEHNLIKKGFILDFTRDHRYFHHEYNGVRTGISTHVSHGGGKDVDDFLISEMRKQLRLDKKQQACDLFNCPMKGDDYNDILRQKKIIPD